ncbi:hypothetical protein G7Y79_00031g066300 [Physcia stellaris]|nr:hypothetical protein G7Y79_00031g066300 [Physcia stellaris]
MAKNTTTPTNLNDLKQNTPSPIDSLLWQNRYQIKDAYEGSTRHGSFGIYGLSTPSCPWNVCTTDATKQHTHLHRTDTGNCEWNRCEKQEAHIHKYKPPPPFSLEDKDPAARYDRVKHVLKEILGSRYEEQPLVENVFLRLEGEREEEEAERERKAKRLADAERAGDEAAREFEEARVERKAKRVEETTRAKKVGEALERRRIQRRTARAHLALEMDTGNELERHFDLVDDSSSETQSMRNAQLGVFQSARGRGQFVQAEDPAEETGDKVPSAVALGKRRRGYSAASTNSSLTDLDANDPAMIIEQENRLGSEGAGLDTPSLGASHFPQSRISGHDTSTKKRKRADSSNSTTSSLTDFDAAELDMIIEQATVSSGKGWHPSPAKSKAGHALRPRASDATIPKTKRQRVEKSVSDTSSLTELDAADLDQLMEHEAPPDANSTVSDSATSEGRSSPQSWTSELTSYNLEELDALLGGAEVVVQDPNSPPFLSPWSTPPQTPSNDLDLENVFDRELRSSIADCEAVVSPYIGGSSSPPMASDGEESSAIPVNQSLMPLQPVPRQTLNEAETEADTEMEEQLARRRQIQWVMKDQQFRMADRNIWANINIYEDPNDSNSV